MRINSTNKQNDILFYRWLSSHKDKNKNILESLYLYVWFLGLFLISIFKFFTKIYIN